KKYFDLRIACPFLENELCSIYTDRPLVCREYQVTSPVSHCQNLDVSDIDSVVPPGQISRNFENILRDSSDGEGRTALIFALEWDQAAAGSPPQPDAAELLSHLQQANDNQQENHSRTSRGSYSASL
ncbi:MAG TPA: YkgJ family cysteine cluster protein, partial [Phycisphaerae bacterium]